VIGRPVRVAPASPVHLPFGDIHEQEIRGLLWLSEWKRGKPHAGGTLLVLLRRVRLNHRLL
jgi:hypothetical protein